MTKKKKMRRTNWIGVSSSSSSSVSDTTRGSYSSSRSTSEADCVSNTFEPEKPEIKREDNTITGTICDGVIRSSNEREIITALAGNDEVAGKEADDLIYGNDGDDKLSGNSGDDILQGGSGDDHI